MRSDSDPVETLAAWIDNQMQASVDPAFRVGQRRIFQHEVDSYGVRTPRGKELIREVYRAVKSWPPAQRNRQQPAHPCPRHLETIS